MRLKRNITSLLEELHQSIMMVKYNIKINIELLLSFVVSMISPLYNGRWFYWLIKQGYQTKTTYHHMYRTNSII